MMTFETTANNHVATNSLKPVSIVQLDEYGEDFHLNMPDGDLYIDSPIMNEWFESFDDARKWAEHRVGVSVNFICNPKI
jgi:hypothetical protein